MGVEGRQLLEMIAAKSRHSLSPKGPPARLSPPFPTPTHFQPAPLQTRIQGTCTPVWAGSISVLTSLVIDYVDLGRWILSPSEK